MHAHRHAQSPHTHAHTHTHTHTHTQLRCTYIPTVPTQDALHTHMRRDVTGVIICRSHMPSQSLRQCKGQKIKCKGMAAVLGHYLYTLYMQYVKDMNSIVIISIWKTMPRAEDQSVVGV